MEKVVFKNLLIFGFGVVAGLFAGYKFTKDYYENFIDEEIESVKEYYGKIKENEKVEEVQDEIEVEEVKRQEEDYTDYNKVAKSYGNLPQKPDIFRFTKERVYDHPIEFPPEDPAEEDDEEFDEANILVSRMEGIEIISNKSFFEEFVGHDKISVTYYERDNTLADDKDGIVPDPINIIGEEALDNFGYLSDDPDIVYVRNHNTSTDFEIVRLKGSYSKQVLGIEDEKPEKKQVVKKVRKVKTDGEV